MMDIYFRINLFLREIMIICLCNNVNEDTILSAIEKHQVTHIDTLREKLSVCNKCCQCEHYISCLIDMNDINAKIAI